MIENLWLRLKPTCFTGDVSAVLKFLLGIGTRGDFWAILKSPHDPPIQLTTDSQLGTLLS